MVKGDACWFFSICKEYTLIYIRHKQKSMVLRDKMKKKSAGINQIRCKNGGDAPPPQSGKFLKLDRGGLVSAFVYQTDEYLTGIVAPLFNVIRKARAIGLNFKDRAGGQRVGFDGRFENRLWAFHAPAVENFRHCKPPFK
jgi:hypothetical protein